MTVRYPKTPPRLERVFIPFPVYFLTICTHARRKILDDDIAHAAFTTFCRASHDRNGISVGRYVLMPDHVHLFVSVHPDRRLGTWVGLLKQAMTVELMKAGATHPVWQRGFFDHVLRSSESYSEKWAYVEANPVRAGLVTKAEDWPYSGELVPIRW